MGGVGPRGGLHVPVHGARARRARGGARRGRRRLSPRRILVVDDHEDNRRILRDLLGSAGYEVLEATTGEEAVARAEAAVPDLILMDIQLPGIDGYEATRRIKANEALRRIPLIVVTSYALSGDDAKALAAGADAYVAKPFSPRALLAKVRQSLA
ncbi:MAG TPA: response regulator [Methylomirabilota bacterium]|nr:response regulator [Methylomirabilota bacterium]